MIYYLLTFICGMVPGALLMTYLQGREDDSDELDPEERCPFVNCVHRCDLRDGHRGPHSIRGFWHNNER